MSVESFGLEIKSACRFTDFQQIFFTRIASSVLDVMFIKHGNVTSSVRRNHRAIAKQTRKPS